MADPRPSERAQAVRAAEVAASPSLASDLSTWDGERTALVEVSPPAGDDERPRAPLRDPRPMTPAGRAQTAIDAVGIPYERTQHGPVRSLEEAAAARGVTPDRIIKSLVVRRADDDFLIVLVPGGRVISWPKLRALLGVSRLSMPPAEVAFEATGYVRGTITPFGSLRPWPVIADASVPDGAVSIGGGAHGIAFTVAHDDLVRALDARVADVTDPQ